MAGWMGVVWIYCRTHGRVRGELFDMFDTLARVSSIPLPLFFPEIGIPRYPMPTTTFRATCRFILWHTTTREFPTSNDNIWIISTLLVVLGQPDRREIASTKLPDDGIPSIRE